MPLLVSAADGNFTTAATWGLASDGTGAIVTAISAFSTTAVAYAYGSTFTGTTGHVVDGVAMFCKRLNTSGTVTIALSDDNGVTATREVTVNASDMPTDESWVFFKFGSTLTLDGGTDYRVGIKATVGSNVQFGRDGTSGNHARILRQTTAPGSVAAGDTFLICGEWTAAGSSTSRTVTMDSTAATDYGSGTATATAPTQTNTQAFTGLQIGQLGTLTWAASAATNYILRLSGNLVVWSGGTYNQGTVATPCPRDSTMTLEFDCAADGDFGFLAFNGSTVSIQGLSRTSGKNIYWTLLNTDEAANSTSLGVADDTGWLDNDRIAVASTTRTRTECEAGTLNGAAGASTLTVDGFAGSGGGLAFAHSGTSPTQAEVILLTRNVKVQSVSSTNMTYVYIGNATVDIDWCEFRYIGVNATNKFGVNITCSSGNVSIEYSSVSDYEVFAINITSATPANTLIRYTVIWAPVAASGITLPTPTSITGSYGVQDCVLIGAGSGSTGNAFVFSSNLTTQASAPYIKDCRVGGFNAVSVAQQSLIYQGVLVDGLIAHSSSCTSVNGFWSTQGGLRGNYKANNMTFWRMNGVAVATQAAEIYENLTCFGNTTANVSINSAGPATIINGVLNSETGFTTTSNIIIGASETGQVDLINCDLSTPSGNLTAATNDLAINTANVPVLFGSAINTKFGASVEFLGQANMTSDAYSFTSSKHDRVAGAYKTWKRGGTIDRDTTIFNTAAPSERLTPISASVKLIGSSRLVGVDNAATKTISVYVRKSVIGDGAAYNGNQPRLILKRNDAVGITSDTVLDTMTAAAGSWEQLSATTAAATDDGAFEVYVDCDGTAGWVNVDDWSVT